MSIYTPDPYQSLVMPFRRTFSGPLDQFAVGQKIMSDINAMLPYRVTYPGFTYTDQWTCIPWIVNHDKSGWLKLRRAVATTATAAKVGSTSRQIIGSLTVPYELVVGSGYTPDQQPLAVRTVIYGTCTASAAGTSTFILTLGGSNAVATDQTLITIAITSATTGTSIPFCIEIMTTFRYHFDTSSYKTISSARLINNGTTGISTAAVGVYQGSEVSSNFSALGYSAIGYMNVTHQSSSASVTPTFQQVVMEVIE